MFIYFIVRKTALANQPPGKNADDDYADIPYSMKELMKGKQQAKNAGKRKRNKFKNLHREGTCMNNQCINYKINQYYITVNCSALLFIM